MMLTSLISQQRQEEEARLAAKAADKARVREKELRVIAALPKDTTEFPLGLVDLHRASPVSGGYASCGSVRRVWLHVGVAPVGLHLTFRLSDSYGFKPVIAEGDSTFEPLLDMLLADTPQPKPKKKRNR